MASLRAASSQAVTVRRQASCRPALSLPARRTCSTVRASVQQESAPAPTAAEFGKFVALSSAVTTLMSSGNALAATELAQLAESDGRFGILATLFVPVVGWVLFNIAGPLFNQLDAMADKAADNIPSKRSLRLKRSIAGALGLGAAGLLASAPAEAATEITQLAAGDNRVAILATLFVPVVGWVLFNIAGPLFNQLDAMGDKAAEATPDKRSVRRKRSIAGALGLGAASLLASAPAEAATELAQLAESDGRFGILATLFVPVVGWVLFNIAGPLFNQLDNMADKAADTIPSKRSLRLKRSIAGAMGLGAAGLLASAPAEAVTELAQLAESDGRFGILATLFVPVVGWVLFNIAGPLFNQLDNMADKAADTIPSKRSLRLKRGVAGAVGVGAAGLLASAPAEAATELAQLAASDNRIGILATLFVPVVGWVLFNIAGPLFNQLDNMGDKAAETTPEKRSIRNKRR